MKETSDDPTELPERQSTPNPRFSREKARRAARSPRRVGERCRAKPAAYQPIVDRSRCEGKGACVEVCPYGVFEVRRIDAEDFATLSSYGRLKSIVHGRKTAYTPAAELCQACGLCVAACPEKALTLQLRT